MMIQGEANYQATFAWKEVIKRGMKDWKQAKNFHWNGVHRN